MSAAIFVATFVITFVITFAVTLAVLLCRPPLWLRGLFAGLLVMVFLLARASFVAAGFALLLALLLAWLSALLAAAYFRRRSRPAAGEAEAARLAAAPLEREDIPGYELLEAVASGGMATVYRGRRKADGRIVAVKVPVERYLEDAKFVRRFHREAELAKRLDHPGVVRVLDHGGAGDKHYLVMEFIDGRSLESYIAGGDLSSGFSPAAGIALSTRIVIRVAEALMHIHAAGIVHGDIKPANIMIVPGAVTKDAEVAPGAVKVMDFGIAEGKVLSRLTPAGKRAGTPFYMSPEQAKGLKLDERSDIYSLGLVFYELLTGQTAFKGSYEAVIHQRLFGMPPPPKSLNPHLPKALDSLVMQMIAKEPENRPPLKRLVKLPLALSGSDPSAALPGERRSRLLRLVVAVKAQRGVLRIFDAEGNLHRSLGDVGVGKDDLPAAASAIAADGEGNLYLATAEYRANEGKMIRKLDPHGREVLSFAPHGAQAGGLLQPVALAVSSLPSHEGSSQASPSLSGRVYVLDAATHKVLHYDGAGRFTGAFGGQGEGRGLFNDPRGLALGPDGAIYVLDYGNRQIQRLSAEGHYQTRWAFRLRGESLRLLDGFTVAEDGSLYISDASSKKVRRVTPQGALTGAYALGSLASSSALLELGVDERGRLYAVRRGGQVVQVYDPDGHLLFTYQTYAPVVQMVVSFARPPAR